MIENMLIAAKQIILSNKKSTNSGIEFKELWKQVVKKCEIKNEENMISDFYQELIENNDFIKIDEKRWTLRELISYEKYEALSKSLFSNNLDSDVEENYQEFMSQQEINESKHGFRNSDTASLEIEQEEQTEQEVDEVDDMEDDEYEEE